MISFLFSRSNQFCAKGQQKQREKNKSKEFQRKEKEGKRRGKKQRSLKGSREV